MKAVKRTNKVLEIIFYGRAGQGGKSIADLYAKAAMIEGKHILAFPEYGAARQGAPLKVFVRIGDKEIRNHGPIELADIAVILDESLLESQDVKKGLKDDGLMLINTHKEPETIKKELSNKLNYQGEVKTLDGTALAQEILKTARLSNTAMLGGLIKNQELVSYKQMRNLLKEEFSKRFTNDIVEKNLKLFDKGYELVK